MFTPFIWSPCHVRAIRDMIRKLLPGAQVGFGPWLHDIRNSAALASTLDIPIIIPTDRAAVVGDDVKLTIKVGMTPR